MVVGTDGARRQTATGYGAEHHSAQSRHALAAPLCTRKLGWRGHETGALRVPKATTTKVRWSSTISGADTTRKNSPADGSPLRLRMVGFRRGCKANNRPRPA